MSHVVEAHPHVNATKQTCRRQKLLTKKLTLLNRLVRLPMFQFLVGNLRWCDLNQPRKAEPGKQYINVPQTLLEKFQDMLLFALLLLAAPFYAFNKFLSRTLIRSFWPRFAFGILCGSAFMLVLFNIVNTFLSRFLVS